MPARVAPSLVAEVYGRSQAARWGLPIEHFEAALNTSVAHAFAAASPSDREIERHVSSLHLKDLALAAACAASHERAWDHFVIEYRPALYRSADAIDPTGGARELADSLYGELFGLNERDGVRQSLFRYFHGRSSLATWLRAVLSQRYIDRLRTGHRTDPLPDEDSSAIGAAQPSAPDLERPRFVSAMRQALAAAIAALAPRDRLRLGCYYAQDLTLAEIGALLGEHEATVSRHLARIRRAIRDAVEQGLREKHGLDETALAECFRSVVDDAGSLDLAELIGAPPERKTDKEDRSKDQGERRGR
jgi:RNA polymerase sigma factor (sigma-70 family)